MTASPFVHRPQPALLGVIHLLTLPGAPGGGQLDAALRRATADAAALASGGADGIIVENLGDAPFCGQTVEPVTVAAMTRIALAVREAAPGVTLGINVLRNDALAALAVAAAVGADFVRVNVLSGAMVTDQGILEGRAREVAVARHAWAPEVRVAADVLVKHAAPLGPMRLEDAARDTWHRAGADALIVSGTGTGRPTDPRDLERVRDACPQAPLWLGSGFHPELAPRLAPLLDAAVVGTWLHEDADLHRPLDAARVALAARALRGER